MSSSIRFTAAALAVAAAFPALALEQELAPIVVTATRHATRANEVISDVTVIDHEQIQKAGQSTLAELLGRQPGVEFTSNGGPGTNTSVLIRGGNSTQTVVLIDGVRVGSATSGDVAFSRIPLSQIDHVEILRGPASSLYGSDAIGGVIQIFTKRGNGKPVFNASAGYGTYNTSEETAGVSGGTETVSYSLQTAYSQTDGFSAIRNPASTSYNADNDGYRDASMSSNVSFRPSQGNELGVSVFYSAGRSQYDSTGTGTPKTSDFVNKQTLINYSVYSRNELTDSWTSTLRAGLATDNSYSGSTLKDLPQFRTDQTQLQWQNDVRLPLGQALFALESLKQEVDGVTAYNLKERTIRSFVSGWNGNLGKHRFQFSVRRDNNSQFGGRTTGAAGYGYQLTSEWRASISTGTAFRAPSFNNLYFPGQSNPNLNPERARNRELGLNWEKGVQSAGVVYYDNRVSDLIVFVGSAPVNVQKAKLTGWTFSYGGAFAGTRFDASFDRTKHRDMDTQLYLPRRADQQLKLSASRDIMGWTSGVEFQAIGKRYDDTANAKGMGGYSLWNLYTEKKVAADWTVFGRVNNVFDKTYEVVRDFGTPGANLFVGVRYNSK